MTEDLTTADFFRERRPTDDPYPFYACLRIESPVKGDFRLSRIPTSIGAQSVGAGRRCRRGPCQLPGKSHREQR